MEHIGNLFAKDYSVPRMKGISNERQLVIYEFLELLNRDRVGNVKMKLKPLSPSFVGSKMSHMKTWELKIFLGECKYAKNFSSYWWWALDPKKHEIQRKKV